MKTRNYLPAVVAIVSLTFQSFAVYPYTIVDTGQTKCYDDQAETSCPAEVQTFYGQDSNYTSNAPSYTLSADGLTVYDNNTGLTWTQSPDLDGNGIIDVDDKLTFTQAQLYDIILNAESYGGFDDWRLPSIKEIYSLMNFSGVDPSGQDESNVASFIPFIDTGYFDFGYGDSSAGERAIDAQFCTTTVYVDTVMDGKEAMFGLNLADGRIKGYPTETKTFYVYFVRGNTDYGKNNYVDNGDGTVTDLATGLMWTQDDSGYGMNWQSALDYAENLEYAGHSDWRLPNVKELQSIVDYTRSPATDGTAAIDPIFTCTEIIVEEGNEDFPFYWSSTTHSNMAPLPGTNAAYVCFGSAYGYMERPPRSGIYVLQDVHGAGAQRSDPKYDDGTPYPHGHGPQGDVIRIYNYVRCVRDAGPQCGDYNHQNPEGDLTGDCDVDLSDVAELSSNWPTYPASVLNDIAGNWLERTGP